MNVTPKARAMLQLALAVIGGAIVLLSLAAGIGFLALGPRSPSGFAEGLAILFFGVHALAGFVILAVGLSIPQRDGAGVRFTPFQRRLLLYGAVAPVAAVVSVPLGASLAPPLSATVADLLVAALVIFLLSGPGATLVAIGLRLRQGSVLAQVRGATP